jgi:hypothetical protein
MQRNAVLVLALSALGANACWLAPTYDTPVIEGDDVRMDPPGSDGGFRDAGEQGEAYVLARDTANDANAWVSDTVEGMGEVVRTLNGYPEDRRDGQWRVYGPHVDEDGSDLAWLVRISGDAAESSVEIYVGADTAADTDDMDLILWGDIAVDGSTRKGGFSIDFDAYARHPELAAGERSSEVVTGTIHVDFARDTKTRAKQVDIVFDGVSVDDGDELVDFDGETYAFHRGPDGDGSFHLGARSSFEAEGWSGPDVERMALDMVWDRSQAGRARGMIVESRTEGDLLFGDVRLDECFDAKGGLTWRFLTEAYAKHEPVGYNFGSETTCVVDEASLGE